ncbi:hypothetical protein [Candidatus Hepatobacter penaei]|nr:hypothetical protein [Candidatus Hepatobacter penaei]
MCIHDQVRVDKVNASWALLQQRRQRVSYDCVVDGFDLSSSFSFLRRVC